jgi:hypothetical protein
LKIQVFSERNRCSSKMGAAGSIPNGDHLDLNVDSHRDRKKSRAAPEWLKGMRAQSRLRTPSERFLSFTADDPKRKLVHCWCCFEMTKRKKALSDNNLTSGVTRYFCSQNCYDTSCSETAIANNLENAETKIMDMISSNIDATSFDEDDLLIPPGLCSNLSVADDYDHDDEFDCTVERVNSK